MKRLAVIPSDTIEDYLKGGYSKKALRDYYNPCQFFDEVYLLSPLEKDQVDLLGMKVIHTPVKELKKQIKQLNINVLRAYGGKWACKAACENKVPGVPVIVSVHDRRPEYLYDSIAKADFVFCVSEVVKDLVSQKFDKPERIRILPNRVDMELMCPVAQTDQARFDEQFPFKHKILFVGRLSDEKNLDTLIKSLKYLGKDYCLLIIGPGDKGLYRDTALKTNMEKQCFFLGSVMNEDLPQYYSWCDCMCTPSRSEGFGMVFIEALSCEAVVVTSDIQPMNTYIKDKENGLLVQNYENPFALAEAIQKACLDNDLRSHLKKNTRPSVGEFEKSRIDKLEVEYYQQCMRMLP